MSGRRGSSWALAVLNLPYLVLARSGLLGSRAQDEADIALTDLAAYLRFLLPLLAVLGLVVAAVVAYALS